VSQEASDIRSQLSRRGYAHHGYIKSHGQLIESWRQYRFSSVISRAFVVDGRLFYELKWARAYAEGMAQRSEA
jgi:hypothetical protein